MDAEMQEAKRLIPMISLSAAEHSCEMETGHFDLVAVHVTTEL
jgi:hypothetical protein